MKTGTTLSEIPVWRVVIIEDSPEDRDEIRRLLFKGSDRRYQFAEAETGAAGMRAVLDTSGGLPDCVVLDYALHDMDALEVLAGMVGADGQTVCPVVVLTGTADPSCGPAVLRAGAQDFIGKGWMTAESLTRAVENAAERWAMTRELQARTAALQASETQLKSAVEIAGMGVNRIDYRTHSVVLDTIAAAMFGLKAGVPLPRSAIHATFHPDDAAEIFRLINQSLDPDGNGWFVMEHRVVHPDGSIRWLSVKKQVEFGDVGGIRRPVTAVLAAIDVTTRKRAEEQLLASEEFNRSLMYGSTDCIKVLDLEGRLLFVNSHGLCAMEIDDFGPLWGQPWPTLWPADTHLEIQRAVASGAAGIPYSFRAFCPTAKGTPRWWDVSVSSVRDPAHGRVVRLLAVSRDITERRRLEEHLRQSQKMEAIGRLAGGIAHDFNNIMTVITGFSELLLEDGVLATPLPAAERLDCLHHIHDAGLRAAALTQQIMAFSRRQVLVPSVLDPNAVLRDVEVMVKRLIGSNIEFVTDLAPDLGHVKADPTQVGQVVLNLATNARDAMPRGGRLVVATRNVELDEAAAQRLSGVAPGCYVVLSFADTGFGMSEEVRSQVFDPFFTTKGVGAGTGMGLATVYGIVRQSGGHIEVESEVGVGTTFCVFLPLVTDPTTPPASREIRLAAKGHETILIVDDDDAVRQMVKTMLKLSGYTILEAADGQKAVETAEAHAAPIHLLITDIVMPHVSGREVAETLAPLKPGMRVLFISGYTEDVVVRQGVELAAADFLYKPFSLTSLTGKVRQILDRL